MSCCFFLYIPFPAKMHGILHGFPVSVLLLDGYYFAVTYRLRGPLFIRVYHLHEILIRIHQGLLQIHDQLSHGLISSVRTLLAALEHNLLDTDRNFRNEFPWRRQFFLYMFNCNCNGSFSIKRNTPCQHFKQGNTEGINIALFIRVSPSCLFRRRIMNGSHHIRGNRITGRCLGNTKIRHLHLSFFGNNDILRLDITVDNMIVVCSLNSHTDLDGNTDCLSYRQSGFLFNIFLKGDPFYKLHHDIVNAVFLSHIVHIHYIRVHQACCRLRLNTEF